MTSKMNESDRSDNRRPSSTTIMDTVENQPESHNHDEKSEKITRPTPDRKDTENLVTGIDAKTSRPGLLTKDKDDSDQVDRQQSPSLRQTHSAISRTPSATENPSFSPFHEAAFIGIICAAQLLTQAGLAQAVAPLHQIGATLGNASSGQLSWLPAAYSLTVGTFILPAGRWGDLYGHRRLFLVGWIFYAVWTLVAGFAAFSHSLIFFAFCRAMQGIGPAILLPNGLAILGRTYPPGKRKNMVFSLFGATAPIGFIFGALFAGIFTQFVWWPWNYWVGGMVMVICAAVVPFVIPPMPMQGAPPSFEELDFWGTVTGVPGLVLFNFAWNQAPSAGWSQPYIYVLLIVGVLFLTVFFWIEFKVTKYPLLPRWVFNIDNNLVFGCIALGWASFGIWVYYLWQFQGVIRGLSILLTTAEQAPSGPVGMCSAIVTGFALGRIGPGWTMLCAMVAFLLGNILLAIANPDTTYWGYIFVANVVMPIGLDMSFPAGCLIMSNFMPVDKQGMAASILLVILNYSISIGLGMSGTVQTYVSDGSLLKGIRGALYLAIGFDVLGLVLAAWLTLVIVRRKKLTTKAPVENKNPKA